MRERRAITWALAAVALAFRIVLQVTHADLGFDDDTGYLAAGLNFLATWVRRPGEGALYSVWWWAESHLVRDRVVLYYAHWAGLLALNLVAMLLILRRLGVREPVIRLAVATLPFLQLSNTRPFVSLFATAIVQWGAWAALGARHRVGAAAWLAGAFGVACFARPELTLAFALSSVAVVVLAIRDRERPGPALAAVAGALLPFLALAAALGSPLFGGRSVLAFGQHYALNVATAEGLRIDSWNLWADLVTRDFGRPVGLAEALWIAPGRLAWHVGRNLLFLWRGGQLFLPVFWTPSWPGFPVGGLVALGFGAGLWAALARRRERPFAILLLGAAALAASALSAALAYHPRPHYFPAVVSLLAVAGVAGLDRAARGRRWDVVRPPGAIAAIALCGAVLAVAASARPEPRTRVAAARFLATLRPPGDGSVRILEADFGRALYAGLTPHYLSPFGCLPAGRCLGPAGADVVVVDPWLSGIYQGDATLGAVLSEPAAFGYERAAVPGTDVVLLLKGFGGVPPPDRP